MKYSFFAETLALTGLAVFGAPARLKAEIPGIQIAYADVAGPRLAISGATGTVQVIQCRESLDGSSVWRALAYSSMTNSPWVWQDRTLYGTGARFYRVVAITNTPPPNPNPDRLVWIPPGTFTMGSPTNEADRSWISDNREGPQTHVTLTQDFFVDKYPVTQADYLSLLNTNPSYFTTNNGYSEDLRRPVDQVTWYDATNYCWVLTQREQLAGRLPAGWTYRLPTEAEWEYVGRAGTITPFSCGSDLRSGMADFNGQYEYVGGIGSINNPDGINPVKTAVGTYPPNPWGLYDVIGNTQNWCLDPFWFYPGGSVTDVIGTPTIGYSFLDDRTARGGGGGGPAWLCRSAFRNNLPANDANVARGLRVVLARGQP